MPRYDYKTVKARHFFASRMVATDKSAYISEDINSQEVDHLLANGYRYVATREDMELALFEKEIKTPGDPGHE